MSTAPRITVHQGLSVAGLEIVGPTVKVLLTGGCAGWSGTVCYDFTDDGTLDDFVARVREWRDQGHPVTVVERGSAAHIVDEQALFDAALGPLE
jgi:hypothetical protein